MRKRPSDLSIEELTDIGQAAADTAVKEALDAGLPVAGWDEKKRKLIFIKPDSSRRKAKALKAAS